MQKQVYLGEGSDRSLFEETNDLALVLWVQGSESSATKN